MFVIHEIPLSLFLLSAPAFVTFDKQCLLSQLISYVINGWLVSGTKVTLSVSNFFLSVCCFLPGSEEELR